MDKEQFENTTGVKIIIPEKFTTDSDEKVDVQLSCGHEKRCKIKSLLKRTPTCIECKPRKKRVVDTQAHDTMMETLENYSKEDLLMLIAGLSTNTLKKFFATE